MQWFSTKDYLMIDIANSYGLDKKSWNERIKWVKDHIDSLENHIAEAEEPALFYTAIKVLKGLSLNCDIHYPISLDATASGIQILSVILNDRKAAEKCNVLNTDKREDIYTSIYNIMCNKLKETGKIVRDDVKSAIMTSCYGSQARPKEIFGEGDLYNIFLQTMEEELPLVWEANKTFLDIWNPKATEYHWIMPDNFHCNVKITKNVREVVHWYNEPIEVITKQQMPTKEGRSIGANITHSIDGMIVREIVNRAMIPRERVKEVKHIINNMLQGREYELEFDENVANKLIAIWDNYKQSGFLSSRILHYIFTDTAYYIDDPQAVLDLINTLPERSFEVIAVHDCFRCLPQFGNELRQFYIQLLYELNQSNILEYILRQITGNPKITVNRSNLMGKEILESEYALS